MPCAYPRARHSLRQDVQVFALEKEGEGGCWEGCLVRPKEGGDGRARFYEGKRASPPTPRQHSRPLLEGLGQLVDLSGPQRPHDWDF